MRGKEGFDGLRILCLYVVGDCCCGFRPQLFVRVCADLSLTDRPAPDSMRWEREKEKLRKGFKGKQTDVLFSGQCVPLYLILN